MTTLSGFASALPMNFVEIVPVFGDELLYKIGASDGRLLGVNESDLDFISEAEGIKR